MAATPSVAEAIAEVAQNTNKKQRTLWGDAWRRFKKHRLAMFGSVMIIFLILTVLIGPSVWTVDRDALDFAYTMSNPIPEHPLGTDELGRDLLARALYGGRISLAVGVTAMIIAILLGSVIGAVSGYLGGYIDEGLSFLTNLFLSLPQLPLLLLTVYLFRDSVTKVLGIEFGMFVIVVVMVGVLAWMSTARIVRATFISLKQKEFVEAAVCIGVKQSSIMFKHILPNAMSPIIVAATLEIGSAILSESTLSFLGIGFPPDTPTWGRLVTDGSQYLQVAPHLPLIPAALIFITVLSINFMGDGLRDALDPRSRL
jgi:peptide/nickel transport system permease protein